MKEKNRNTSAAVGTASLLVIFAVLCLTILALLSLNTVQAQRRISDSALEGITEYYAADLEAQTIFARLRAGEQVPGVMEEGGRFTYTCPISQHQTLYIALMKAPSGWTVQRWQAEAQPDIPEETLPVWNGQIKEGTP